MDYNLKDDEEEIVEAFSHNMSTYGYHGFYSFFDSIQNGYLIYNEDDHWVYKFYVKGEMQVTKKYTNLYNLCLDILKELKIDDFDYRSRDIKVPKGTMVIISKSSDCPIDDIKQGVIFNSTYDREKNERIYQVLGDDNLLYTGVYGFKIFERVCFRTMEDYIADCEEELSKNNEDIKDLQMRNWALTCNIEELKGKMDDQFGRGEKYNGK